VASPPSLRHHPLLKLRRGKDEIENTKSLRERILSRSPVFNIKVGYSAKMICITSDYSHVIFQSNSRNENINLSNELSTLPEININIGGDIQSLAV